MPNPLKYDGVRALGAAQKPRLVVWYDGEHTVICDDGTRWYWNTSLDAWELDNVCKAPIPQDAAR